LKKFSIQDVNAKSALQNHQLVISIKGNLWLDVALSFTTAVSLVFSNKCTLSPVIRTASNFR
jgi:hypothetical protein